LDYTKVIILILWWRNFQLEYWRTFQLVSTTLILQAEKYYPGFHQLLCEIEKNEMVQLKQIIINAQKNGEIRSTCNTDLLVQQIRLVFLGKSYQDALKNGLDINGLREQLYFIYFLIKNK